MGFGSGRLCMGGGPPALHPGCTGSGRGVLGQSWLWPRAQAGGPQESS